MRVIAGTYRHRILKWPDDVKHIRPTKDRIREAIFGALGDISGAVVLDLYAGSGAMGIEAISRGANKAVFVDISPVALSVTKDNLKSLGIPNQIASVYGLEDTQAIKRLSEEGYQFDLIILDPPYKEGKYEEIINFLKVNNLLKEHSVIVTECDHEIKLPIEEFSKVRNYKYGDIRVNILWR